MKLPTSSYLVLLLSLACMPYVRAMESSKASIHIVSRKNQVAELTNLLEAGVPVDSQDEKGFTPLHIAATVGHQKIVALLIAYNANVLAQTPQGQTPYDLAEDHGHENIALMLKTLGEKQGSKEKKNHNSSFTKQNARNQEPFK